MYTVRLVCPYILAVYRFYALYFVSKDLKMRIVMICHAKKRATISINR